MRFDLPLVPARLVRRYKRFLADCILDETGSAITASVPNTGSMLGLSAPGSRVLLSRSDDPKRKYAHRLEIVEADDTWVGINTGLPNRLAEEAISKGLVGDLARYPHIGRERAYGTNSRVDIVLGNSSGADDVYVEVKNVHLMREPGLAEFPDSKTSRGVKHLGDLAEMVNQGRRAVMLFVIQRGDCERFSVCGDIDDAYMKAFVEATRHGVEAFAVTCKVTPDMIEPVARCEIIAPRS